MPGADRVPGSVTLHQLAVTRLAVILSAACPAELVVLAGVGVNITKFQHRVPDIAVVRADSLKTVFQETPPALVVEVASPRTRLYDRNRKKDLYQSSGIPAYWVLEPDRDRPELTVFELRSGACERTAHIIGDEQYPRARRRERDRERRADEDAEFQAKVANEIIWLFPECPTGRAEAIARHTSLRGSGRVGRSAAGRSLERSLVGLVPSGLTPFPGDGM